MMSNLPEHWLTNAAVALANGCVRRLLLEVSIELVQFSRQVLSLLCLKVIKRKVLDQRVVSAVELESGSPTALEPA